MSLRVTPAVKRQLDDAAAAAGRSLSQEAEFRLEQSFAADWLREIAQDFQLAFAHFGMQAAQDAGRPELLKSGTWRNDPDCFKRALAGASLFVIQSGHAPSVSIEYRRALVEAVRERVEAVEKAEENRETIQ